MISGYAQSGRGSEGLKLFDHFVTEEGFEPDHICFTTMLSACNHAGFLDRGIRYFNKMKKDHGLVPKLDQYACLVDLYARKGHLRKAKELMEEMPFTPKDIILSSFLSSCRIYGAVKLARETAEDLFKMQPHNVAAYVTMVRIYAEAGSWDEKFSVADTSHPKSRDICVLLKCLNLGIEAFMRLLGVLTYLVAASILLKGQMTEDYNAVD
ncbi:hypothetical protein Ancab_023341 [Ancistrocladus abbreviatus]